MIQWRKLKVKDIHNDALHRWLAWFDEKSPQELIKEVVQMDPAIMTANEKLEFISQDGESYRSYWSRRKAHHDYISGMNGALREGIEKGMAKGIKQTTIEVARKMKMRGYPLAEITEVTGLTPKAIEKL